MNLEEALATLDEILQHESLNDIQELVFRQTWEGKTYAEIAEETNYDPDYIKYVGYQLWQVLSKVTEEKVTKSNFKSLLRRKIHLKVPIESTTLSPLIIQDNTAAPEKKHLKDWGEAVDVSIFYGRDEELRVLQKWILEDNCRFILLLGMGGIGKTALSVKLAEQVCKDYADTFEYLIWRSLRNAPPLAEILAEILKFLSHQPSTQLPSAVEGEVTQLIDELRKHRCLIVLDNTESILCENPVGSYRKGYEDYGEFFKRLGEERHQSCLFLTSREKPKEFSSLEGEVLPVRSLQLKGLTEIQGRKILEKRGLSGTEHEQNRLVEQYRGNPLALKIVSTSIRELFDGNISGFLKEESMVFNGLRSLLDQQFDRLSDIEKKVMYWLAINRESVHILELKEDIVPPLSKPKLLETVEFLGNRSLIEKSALGFTQQPVVMEYMTEKLIEQVCQESMNEEISMLMSYALIKAQAKDYIRESQVRVILDPIIDRLKSSFKSLRDIEHKLKHILLKLQREYAVSSGYAGGNILNLLAQLEIDLTGYDFSNLAIWQADLKKVSLHNTNFAFSNLEQSTFAEILGGIYSVALSSDGSLLLTGGDDGEIRLWDFEKARQYLSWSTIWIFSAAFSADNKIVASGSADGTIGLWDAKTGQSLKILKGHTNLIFSVAFSPNGKILVSGSTDGTVRLWDVHTGECIKVLEGLSQAVLSVAFSPDGRFLAGTGHDHSAFIWDLYADECCQILKGHTELVFCLTFSPSGRSLATGSQDQTIRLWDVCTGQCLQIFEGHTDLVSAIAFSPNSQVLASGSKDQTGRLWDVDTGRCLKLLQGYANCFWSLKFHPNGKFIVSGGTDQIIKLWDVDTGQCTRTLQGFSSGFLSVVFNPQRTKQIIASGGEDKLVRIWDINEGQCIRSLAGHSSWVWAIAFSPDGCTLASASEDKIIRLWDVNTGQCCKFLQGHSLGVISVAFSPNGQRLATGSHDQSVRLWDVDTGQCLEILQGHTGWTWCSIFSPNGLILASAGEDKTIRIWDIKTTECIQILEGHASTVLSIAFNRDGTKLVSAAGDQIIKLWNVHTGHCAETLSGHQMAVTSVVFSPNGTQIASASLDQTVRIWDVQTGQCIKILKGHHKGIWSVDFSPDGQYLISGSKDETIKYWNLQTGETVNTLEIKKLYEDMNILETTGLTDAQRNTLKLLGATEKAVY